mgnify:CR=1 FL=1
MHIYPKYLKPGDLLRVIASSGCLREFEAFEKGIEIWRSRGYQVELSPGYDSRWGYLAGKDDDRLTQLTEALNDPNCKGILCARGGYGSTRLLEKRGLPSQTTTPKWLIGFSDVTGLLWNHQRLQIHGVHGPLLTTIDAEPEWSKIRLFDLVEGRSLAPLQGNGWGNGKAKGVLFPANLTVATHLLGTPWQPPFQNIILALEDVGEAPYRIDRMLTQWRMMGVFSGVSAIALGRFSNCDAPPHIPSFTVAEVLRDRLSDLNIPIVSDLPFGHDGVNAALPVGVMAELDGDQGILTHS